MLLISGEINCLVEMAVERPKPQITLPTKSRVEMNVRQLLNKCELMAKQEPIDNNCRLKQYMESLSAMLAELKTGSGPDCAM